MLALIMANSKTFRGRGTSFPVSSQDSEALGERSSSNFFSIAGVEKASLETTVSTETPAKAIPVRMGELVKLHL